MGVSVGSVCFLFRHILTGWPSGGFTFGSNTQCVPCCSPVSEDCNNVVTQVPGGYHGAEVGRDGSTYNICCDELST